MAPDRSNILDSEEIAKDPRKKIQRRYYENKIGHKEGYLDQLSSHFPGIRAGDRDSEFYPLGECYSRDRRKSHAALGESDTARLDERFGITFEPEQREIKLRFVFYPVGRVSPEAYAPLATELSRQGFLVIIPRMALDLAAY